MTGTTLRELARAYAKGELGRDEYRRSRSELVTSILSGEVAVKNIEFPPPIRPPGGDGQDATEPRSRRRREATLEPGTDQVTQVAPPRAPAAGESPATGTNPLIVGIVIAGVVAAAAFFIASRPSGESTARSGGSEPAVPAAPPAAPAPAEDPRAEAGRALISQFLLDRNWSPTRMSAFQSEWSALDGEQQAAALKSADGGRLASAIYQRLLEERALSGLGDAEASLAKQGELVGFAAAIGITDPRLSLPEPAAAADAGTTAADSGIPD